MTEPQIRETDREVAEGLVRLMLSMQGLYARQSRKLGLTAQQAQLLCTAARRRAGVGEIAGVLHCRPSNVSRLLDRVAARGLARRAVSTRDGRVSLVTPSPEGRELVRAFEGALEERLAALVAGWPADRRSVAADALRELVAAVDADLAAEDADDEEEDVLDELAAGSGRR